MASGILRKEVLRSFKELHRTRLKIFEGDALALSFARDKINEEYRKHMKMADPTQISEKVKLAQGVELELRTTVVQAKEVKPGVYEAKFRPETVRVKNLPFKDGETQIEFTTKGKNKKVQISSTVQSGCCQEQKS